MEKERKNRYKLVSDTCKNYEGHTDSHDQLRLVNHKTIHKYPCTPDVKVISNTTKPQLNKALQQDTR